jgi:putative transposase
LKADEEQPGLESVVEQVAGSARLDRRQCLAVGVVGRQYQHAGGRCQAGRCGLGQLQVDHYGRVDAASSSLYKGYRYPVEIISHCVWLYHRFPLSFREVEEMMMMMARGVIGSYETIRAWCAKFGQAFANQLCRRRPRPGDKWHVDEVFIKIQGKSRELPPTHQTEGTGDETLHLTRSRKELTQRLCWFRLVVWRCHGVE